MDLIILPGNSKQYNEQWLYDSEKNFSPLFDSTTIHIFNHWATGEQMANLDTEVAKLQSEVEGKSNYIVYAKSIGTVITIKAVAEGKIAPKCCVFVGSPFSEMGEYKDFLNWVKKFNIHTLFIQQTDDPFFKYADLEKFIEENNIQNYELIEIEGSNHAYDNYDYLKQVIREFITE